MSGVTAFCQRWEKSIHFAGTCPAGYSLHQTQKNCEEFIQKFWNQQPERTPEVYIIHSGEPFKVKVEGRLQKKLDANPSGFRIRGPEAKKFRHSGEFIILPPQKPKRSKSWKRLPTYKRH